MNSRRCALLILWLYPSLFAGANAAAAAAEAAWCDAAMDVDVDVDVAGAGDAPRPAGSIEDELPPMPCMSLYAI